MARITIRIDLDENSNIGHGKIRLLEQIAEHGSISSAARAMGMSYRRAWLLADEVNTMFEQPVLEDIHELLSKRKSDPPDVRAQKIGKPGKFEAVKYASKPSPGTYWKLKPETAKAAAKP